MIWCYWKGQKNRAEFKPPTANVRGWIPAPWGGEVQVGNLQSANPCTSCVHPEVRHKKQVKNNLRALVEVYILMHFTHQPGFSISFQREVLQQCRLLCPCFNYSPWIYCGYCRAYCVHTYTIWGKQLFVIY